MSANEDFVGDFTNTVVNTEGGEGPFERIPITLPSWFFLL